MLISEQAQHLLNDKLRIAKNMTQYLAIYNTKSGRELALERERSEAIYVWLQKYNLSIEDVEVKNEKFPGQPYGPKQSRNSNLNGKNTPKLKTGNRVYYLKITSLQALEKVIDWYDEQ
ncbi:hypothetical protein [Photobacterium marinum]|uniref:hypothetical protein n=1 Tax=Photobacterium marinum TaxID=1056511 RepID=UPI000569FBB8|nr:hypothetical protein [Photobacterium marinum]